MTSDIEVTYEDAGSSQDVKECVGLVAVKKRAPGGPGTSTDSKRKKFSSNEESVLVDAIAKFGSIIECKETQKGRGFSLLKKKNDAWIGVHEHFSQHCTTLRTISELQTKWKNVKSKSRSESTVNTREHFKTGGGLRDPNTDVTDKTEKVMSIITGGTSLRMQNSFDSDGVSASDSVGVGTEFDQKRTVLSNKVNKSKQKDIDTRFEILQLTKEELLLKIENAKLLKSYLEKLNAREHYISTSQDEPIGAGPHGSMMSFLNASLTDLS